MLIRSTRLILVTVAAVVFLTVLRHRFASGETPREADRPRLKLDSTETRLLTLAPEDELVQVAISPDGRRLAAIAIRRNELARWQGTANEPVLVVDGKEYTFFEDICSDSLTFSPDSQRLAFGAASLKLERDFRGILQKRVAAEIWVDMKSQQREFLGLGKPAFSPEGQRLAYTGVTHQGVHFVIDGHVGPAYESFLELENESFVVFSRDGRHYCYVAMRRGQQVLVVDGREYGPFSGILHSALGPDGRRVVCIVKTPEGECFFEDGQTTGPYEECLWRGPLLSPDGQRAVYGIRQNGSARIVDDGVESRPYREILGWCFGPDNRRLACFAHDEKGSYLIVDGHERGPFESLNASTRPFSADGKRLMYAVKRGVQWIPVVDDQERAAFDHLWPTTMVFSSDGRHYSYIGRRGTGMYLVIDGKEWGPYTQMQGVLRLPSPSGTVEEGTYEPFSVLFSADGRRSAHVGRRNDGEVHFIIDGKEGPGYEDGSHLAFSPNGTHFACLAKRNGRIRFVVDGVEHGSYEATLGETQLVFADDRSLYAILKDGNDLRRIDVKITREN